MALENPNDKVTIAPFSKGIKIKVSGLAADTIPTNPDKNTAGVVAKQILEEFSLKTGLIIEIEKGILPSLGLGSSAASASAVAFGLNHLFNLKLDHKQLIRLAAKGEIASAGFEHADNVSAAIYGGFIIIKSYTPLEVTRLESPPNLGICLTLPKVPVTPKKTEKARSVLPKNVSMEKLVHNVGHAATMVAGFATGNVDLIGKSMADAVVEPARAFLVPGYQQVKENALKAGACGVAISGAGPAMIAIINTNKADASKVAEAMEKGFKSAGVSATTICTRPGKGVSMLEVK
ncbi:MAG: Homoserine kinase [Candidatus Bathyarchaeota archaeon BA2]|nr:MAG: Homoserine kinase [Candidatus Bathyarchaeota archaeon BA2]